MSARRQVSPIGRRQLALAVVLLGAMAAAPAAGAGGVVRGGLEQLAGRAGCITQTGEHGRCQRARVPFFTHFVAVSPDGRNVYATGDGLSLRHPAAPLAVFVRDRRSDALRQLPGAAGVGPVSEAAPIVSPDGRNVYVFSQGRILVLARSPRDGRLVGVPGAQGCVSPGGAHGCTSARGMDGVGALAITPDGRSVLATTGTGVAVFARDAASGALSQLPGSAGCVRELGGDGCQPGRGLAGAEAIQVSGDGRSVYTASLVYFDPRGISPDGGLAVFARDPASGALTQLAATSGCLTTTGDDGCAAFPALARFLSLAVSADGTSVYATGAGPTGYVPGMGEGTAYRLVGFARDRGSGALAPLAPTAGGCIQYGYGPGGPCAQRTVPANGFNTVAVSPDGQRIYTATTDTGPFKDGSIYPGQVQVFARDPASGAIGQLDGPEGCVGGRPTDCHPGRMTDAVGLALSPDGQAVYVAASRALVVLVRPIAVISTRPVRVTGQRAALTLRCLAATRCSGTVALRSVRRVRLAHRPPRTLALGHARFSIPPGARRVARVRLPTATLRQLRHARIASLPATASAQASAGSHTHTETARLRLRVR